MVCGIVMLLIGLMTAFFGYSLYKLYLFMSGFLIGALIGIVIAASGYPEGIPIGLVLGIVLGFFSIVLKKTGAFLQWFSTGTILMLLLGSADKLLMLVTALIRGTTSIEYLMPYIFNDMEARIILALIVGVAAGILGVIWMRTFIILSTSIVGGILSGTGICLITQSISLYLLLGGALCIAILGIIIQFRKPEKKKRAKKTAPEAAAPAAKATATAATDQEPAPAAAPQETINTAAQDVIDTTTQGTVNTAAQEATNTTTQGTVNTSAQFSESMEAMREKSSQAMDNMRENLGKTAGFMKAGSKKTAAAAKNISASILDKLRAHRQEEVIKALSKPGLLSDRELLDQLARGIYRNKVMSWIMPFLEPITAALVVVLVLCGGLTLRGHFLLGAVTMLKRFQILFEVAILLGAVKHNRFLVEGLLAGDSVLCFVMLHFINLNASRITSSHLGYLVNAAVCMILMVIYSIKIKKANF